MHRFNKQTKNLLRIQPKNSMYRFNQKTHKSTVNLQPSNPQTQHHQNLLSQFQEEQRERTQEQMGRTQPILARAKIWNEPPTQPIHDHPSRPPQSNLSLCSNTIPAVDPEPVLPVTQGPNLRMIPRLWSRQQKESEREREREREKEKNKSNPK